MQGYRLRARRPFLTVYFIPVVPIGSLHLFVVCDGCRQHWDPSVLEQDPQHQQDLREERWREEVLRAAILVVLIDDQITEAEIDALKRISAELLQHPVDREDLGELCSVARENGISAKNYVTTVSRHWNQERRTVALQAMFLAASAEGKLDGARLDALTQMRDTLELTEREYQQAIESALQLEHL